MGDLSKLNITDCVAVSSDEYIFDLDREKVIADTLRELSNQEYFTPKNSVWWMFRQFYLISPPGLSLGNELYNNFTSNDFSFNLRDNPLTPSWIDFDSYRKSSQGLFFKGTPYRQLEELKTLCYHYINNMKFIKSQGDNTLYKFDVMKTFLDHPSNLGLMCAVFIYYHTSDNINLLDTHYYNILCERLNQWISDYKLEFSVARDIIKPKENYYKMFTEESKQMLFTMWDTLLNHIVSKDKGLLDKSYAECVEDFPDYLKRYFNTYIDSQPQNVMIYYSYAMLWNLLWEVFCLEDNEQELIYTMHLLCVSSNRWESFKKMCVDFVWEVPNITKGLVNRYYNLLTHKYTIEDTNDMCSEYALSLVSNGYPNIK